MRIPLAPSGGGAQVTPPLALAPGRPRTPVALASNRSRTLQFAPVQGLRRSPLRFRVKSVLDASS